MDNKFLLIKLYTTKQIAKSAITISEEVLGAEFGRVKAFPIPFTNQVNFQISGSSKGAHTVTVTDINGRVIWETEIQKQESIAQISWNGVDSAGRNLPVGVYIYKVTNGKEVFVGKIIKD